MGGDGSEIHAPAQVTAGTAITIQTSGVRRRDVLFDWAGESPAKAKCKPGATFRVDSDQLEHAGRYVAVLCASDGCTATNFSVNPAAANRLSFLVHPSRIPVGSAQGISAVAIVRDSFQNLVPKPEPVTFSVWPKDEKPVSAARTCENAVAWVRLTSAKKEGPTKLGAPSGMPMKFA